MCIESLPTYHACRKGNPQIAPTQYVHRGHGLSTIAALGALERFVFVMSILEGQSEQGCAVLLRCSRRDVIIARVLSLTRVVNTDAAYTQASECVQA
jgi:hypothetical protein